MTFTTLHGGSTSWGWCQLCPCSMAFITHTLRRNPPPLMSASTYLAKRPPLECILGPGTHISDRSTEATTQSLEVQSQLSSLWSLLSCLCSHQCTLLAPGIFLDCHVSGFSMPPVYTNASTCWTFGGDQWIASSTCGLHSSPIPSRWEPWPSS